MDNQLLEEAFRQIGITAQSVSQLNHDYTSLSQTQAALSANVEWLMRFFWIIATASVGSFVTALWQLVATRKKRK